MALMTSPILVIEDEPKLAQLLIDYLTQSGYQVDWVDNGLDAVAKVKSSHPQLILLDLMLPGKEGMEVCKEIRQFSSVPIIMVTARVEEIDRLLGLELGADDYVCKPYSPREVVARVKAVLRRTQPTNTEQVLANAITLDDARYKVVKEDKTLSLTAVEYSLLKVLHSEPGRIYSRDQLITAIYDDHRIVSDRTIDSHIKKLRKKLSILVSEGDLIYSVYGVGYKYEEN
jgi:two-component system response regulator BaeR